MLEALRQHFRPEFLNRVDEIVVFHALDARAAASRSSTIQLARLPQRLAERQITLELTDRAKDHLADARLRSRSTAPGR